MTQSNATSELQAARQRAGMTLEAIAERVGHDVSTVSRWMRGKQQPDWEQLELLAKAMKQPITLTFGGKQKETAPPRWAKRLPKEVADEVIAALGPTWSEMRDELIARLEGPPPPPGVDPRASGVGLDQDG